MKEIFNEFNHKVTYIYISTFEADKFALTRYRKNKKDIENTIENSEGYIIRVGYFIEDNKLLISHRNTFILSGIRKKVILIPVTFANDLTKFINKKVFLKSVKRVSSCYSKFKALSLHIFYPFLFLVDLENLESYQILNFPFEYLSELLFYLAKIFRFFRFNNQLIDLLEKPYSLYLQQKIIYNKK